MTKRMAAIILADGHLDVNNAKPALLKQIDRGLAKLYIRLSEYFRQQRTMTQLSVVRKTITHTASVYPEHNVAGTFAANSTPFNASKPPTGLNPVSKMTQNKWKQ